jgi:hypothetical protein
LSEETHSFNVCANWLSVISAKRELTKHKRSAFFTGEITRHCQDCLRLAEGRLITSHEMAVAALNQKGLGLDSDSDSLKDFTKRIALTLGRMLRSGHVIKEGYGRSARWGLPKDEASTN